MAKKQKKVESKPKIRQVFVDVLRLMIRGDEDLISSVGDGDDGRSIHFGREGLDMVVYPTDKQLYAEAYEAARLELLDQLTKKGK